MFNQLTISQLESFASRYTVSDGCWIWKGYKTEKGYGRLSLWINQKVVNILAHRLSFYLHGGELESGLVIDHTCRNPACVNPSHLEQVTNEENLHRGNPNIAVLHRAKTHCINGHEFTISNTRLRVRNGGRIERVCIICDRTRKRG